MKVLIIDDSESTRRVYRRFLEGLESQGKIVEVVEAATARAGLEACRNQRPACILLDFKLPDKNGLELIRELREVTEAPIVFITGNPDPLAQTQAYRLGVAAFLAKDFVSSETLRNSVSQALKEA